MKNKLLIILLGLSIIVVGCAANDARDSVENYYISLVNEEYEKAFNQLLIFDEHYDQETTLSESEAKERFSEKISYLKEKGYQLNDFEIQDVRTDDGGPPLVKSVLTIEVNGDEKKVKELIQVTENGLFVDLSEEDKYAHYRDGKMSLSIKD
ncbi:hypothetical protein [Virgibacillus litoralis]|uniref:Uncharacterized protein n=1 Tax=Virgibacillus litoralis TaxID=578221 RepID=A0ABS4HIZ1_9BACI|nr:hypothetical protein [Virgibacillus litoralis]MBP1950891.1 hypothetical protein [Virgibacillus litoralis]